MLEFWYDTVKVYYLTLDDLEDAINWKFTVAYYISLFCLVAAPSTGSGSLEGKR
jgi:hypothetical protein